MPLSVKTKEHFRRRMALAGPKWGALLGGAVALAGVIMFTTSALHFVTVTDTHGGSTRILTVNQTEAAVLAQAGVAPLGENDRIVTSETPDGELMQVLRAYTVPVTADGQTQEIITTGATTRDLLTQAGLTYTEEDYLTPPPTRPSPRAAASPCSASATWSTPRTRPSPVRWRRSPPACITANRTKCRWSSRGQMAWTL